MAKKILSFGRRNAEQVILGYRLPAYHCTKKSCYVDFYCWDPSREEFRRKKIHLEKYQSKKERKLHADELIATLSAKLRKGWNPWVEASGERQYTPFGEVLSRYLEYVEKTCRPRTVENYRSRVNVLRDYNNSRVHPVRYSYEFDREFVMEFLDYILLDRDTNARTRNNYKCWCSGFGEWMQIRKYINHNPAEGISKIHEDPKKRQPLSAEMMRQLHKHLLKTDRYFLLGCLMEYYTMIRPTELTNLRISDIRLKERKIFVSKSFSKNKRDGYVGLNATLIRLMLDLDIFSGGDDRYLFSKHFHPGTKKMDADIFNKRWVQIRKQLGWSNEYQFYSLKDTGIRDLANAAGIVIARDQARHSDVATTNKYLGASKTVHSETQEFEGALANIDKTPPSGD